MVSDSLESRRLLNPGFTASILLSAADTYQQLMRTGLPLAYCYIVAPLVLHAETRSRLPTTMATKLLTWSERNGDLVATFGSRVSELRTYVSQGVLAATVSGMADLADGTALLPLTIKPVAAYAKTSGSSEVTEILKKSAFVGKWLAAAGTPATVFTALGVSLENRP